MDINLLILLQTFSLIPVVMVFLGPKKAGWALIGLFGVALCFLTALVLANDAVLTQAGKVMASANGNWLSDFNVVTWEPVVLGLTETYLVVRRAFRI